MPPPASSSFPCPADGLPTIRCGLLGRDGLTQCFQALGTESTAANLHSRPRGHALLRLLKRRLREYQALRRQLMAPRQRGAQVSGALVWLLDNDASLGETARDLARDLPPGFHRELPQLRAVPWGRLPRIYRWAHEFVAATDSALDLPALEGAAQAFQTALPLTIGEVWALPTMLRIVLFDNLVRLMARTQRRIDAQQWANDHAARLLARLDRLDPRARHAAASAAAETAAARSPAAAVQFLDRLDATESAHGAEMQTAHDAVARHVGRSGRALAQEAQLDAAADQVTIGSVVTSLRVLAAVDWREFFERVSVAEAMLRRDPSGIYVRQDFSTRDRIRHRVEELSKRHRLTEAVVVDAALRLAEAATPDAPERTLGFWLDGAGARVLERRVAGEPSAARRCLRAVRGSFPAYFAAWALSTAAFALAAVGLSGAVGWRAFAVVALVAVPASEIALGLVHAAILAFVRPRPLPKLDFRRGIAAGAETLVAMPSMLVRRASGSVLAERLELHFLANRDDRLSFALATDFGDAPSAEMPEDDEFLEAARAAIRRLNERYAPGAAPRFFLFHRRRLWNPAQGTWMGWERKRGKLVELNRLLRGAADTTFVETTVPRAELPRPTFVLTLDADTQLPLGAARMLAGAAAHPLNLPRFDAAGKLQGGYALLQPRVNIALPAARRSRFAGLYAGAAGIDAYAIAASDVYQDFFAAGSFVGKGIYHLDSFERLTHRAFPDNAILSHDLIESAFARCGLASDVQLLDEFPTNFHVFALREHRWIRGDWQLLPWLGRRVPRAPEGIPAATSPSAVRETQPTPLDALGRWKLFDNLRRSLLAPSAAALLFVGWLALPGGAWWWTAAALAPIFWPAALYMVRGAVALVRRPQRLPTHAADLRNTLFAALAETSFLIERARHASDAIVRTLWRLFVSRRRLLEWETAASAERRFQPTLGSYFRTMRASPVAALAGAVAVAALRPESLPAAAAPLLAWFAAPWLAYWVGQPTPCGECAPSASDRAAFRRIARRTWAFFETHVGAGDQRLPPDNFQAEPEGKLAHRTSPTNLGLYLLSAAAAHDLGYLSLSDLVERLGATLAAMEKLERHRGHFLNWYDTQSLAPLPPRYLSTVDSGNLLGCLLTLEQALLEFAVPSDFALPRDGIRDTLTFLEETRPGLLPPACDDAGLGKDAAALDAALAGLDADAPALAALRSQLRETEAARGAARAEAAALAARCRALADAMDFRLLYNGERRLFAIGMNLAADRLDSSHYDLLASEAALTSFLAIAGGFAPREHWFQLGRPFARSFGRTTLVSWGGTMFEYLMPRLLLRCAAGTALDDAHRGAVAIQRGFAKKAGVPWGISEAAYNAINSSGDYQYQAFGVPALGLKRGTADLVVAPYASALAAGLDPAAVAANFRSLESLGALADIGFLEALDFTRGRRAADGGPGMVRTYMAHHQGMTLVALANALDGDRMPQRLARNPAVRAAEALLHERVPSQPALLADHAPAEAVAELAGPDEPAREAAPMRRIATPYTAFPRSHILSNGRLSSMVTNAGGGYLAWQGLAVTRWREDRTKDDWGQFLYVQDHSSGRVHSAACQPLGVAAEEEEIHFAADRAVFRRVFRELELRLEIAVSPADDVEVRRLTVVNRTSRRKRIAATTYAELALATPAADRAHPAFQKLFVETEHVPEHHALLARRRARSPGADPPWAFQVMARDRRDGATVECETDRGRFVGRGRGPADPAALDGPLGGCLGSPLDPIFALRRGAELGPYGSWTVSFATGLAPTRELALGLIDRFHDPHGAERAFELAWAHAQEERRRARSGPHQGQLFQRLTAQLLFAGAAFRAEAPILAANRLDRRGLWRHGISGDLPIVLLRVRGAADSELVGELADAFVFWRQRGLAVDLAVLDELTGDYRDEEFRALETLLQARAAADAKDVKLLRGDRLQAEELGLLRAAARCEFIGGQGSLEDQTAARERRVQERVRRPAPALPAPLAERATGIPPAPLEFPRRWGGFGDEGREYVVRTDGSPGSRPPAPWCNVIANPVFGCLADDGGLGYTWSGNAQLHRLTTWSNDPVVCLPPEIVYLKDDENGRVWSATPAPAPAGRYEVRHGFGSTRYRGAAFGLEHDLEVFVAADEPLKYVVLAVRNASPRPRRVTATYYAELVLGGSRDVAAMHTVTELEPMTGALLARNAFDGDFSGGWAFANAEPRTRSFTCDRKEFLGRLGHERAPEGLRAAGLSGAMGAGRDPCFALSSAAALAPGETQRFVFVLGYGESREAAEQLAGRCRAPEAAASARVAMNARWDALTGALQVETPDRAFDLLMNGWLLHQVLSSRIWGRTGFHQSGGAFGFRDQLQDAMALAVAAPWETRAQLLRAASRQFVEGDVQHWWHLPSGAGVRTRITDDLLWLPYAVCHYAVATGDLGLLDEQAPFLDQPPLLPEQEDDYRVPGLLGAGTVFEHCQRAFRCAATRDGIRGLPLIGTGDWNDGMNHVGPKMQGESVWNAWFQATALDDFAALAKVRDPAFAAWCGDRADGLRAACERHAWDGQWYLRATFDDGTPLGHAGAAECEIDVLPQAWAAIAGARPERVDSALAAAKAKLVDDRQRLIKLFAPPFGAGDLQPGYIKSYAPGIRENGGQYTHGAVWLAWAETVRGDGDEAKRLFDLLNPILRDQAQMEQYRGEPYVMPGDVYGAPPHVGRAGWTWYTGSAAWMYRLGIERILGLRRRGARMEVHPCLPRSWPGYRATLRVGKALYRVHAQATPDVEFVEVETDGVRSGDGSFPYLDDGAEHTVQVRVPTLAPSSNAPAESANAGRAAALNAVSR